MTTTVETRSFQAEVNQLLHLVTHALYSNREIFLRELISNAADAADKLRFAALNNAQLYAGDSELKIWIDSDKENRTITIRDNGIGMTREEVISNLGTIARSGTKEFLQKLSADQAKETNLIGQFGVGFYSAYVVADVVTVKTRHAEVDATQGVQWESAGTGDYRIQTIDFPARGTEIILHLKEDADEFLAYHRLRHIITRYSDHILVPVMLRKQDEEGKPTEEYEQVNAATALWTLPKSTITDEQYQTLYQQISHDFAPPLAWTHSKVEGKLDYTSLLFIPKQAPFDLWNREHQHGLKLYVQRVFIMDDADKLLPLYLRFVRGIVDSNDLPLNVSREILQNNKTLDSIRSGCARKVLELLTELAEQQPDKYREFWQEFGRVLKEGPAEDFANKDKIAKLLRFASTHHNTDEQSVSLADYIARMSSTQNKIYYICADSYLAAKNSPHLEIFRKRGIEVLLMFDRVDEWLTAHLAEFEGKSLQSVMKGDLDFTAQTEKSTDDKKTQQADFDSMLKQMSTVLKDNVKEVRLTERLTDSPACLVAEQNEMSTHLQRLMQEAGQALPTMQPILEVNPEHALIARLKAEQDETQFAQWSQLIFEQALLAEGGQLKDPASFVKRMNDLLVRAG